MKVSTLAAFAAFTLSVAAGVAVAAGDESVVRGERLYDNWMREAAEPQPREAQPAFPGTASGVAASDTWRCAECHGWDYKGNHGAVGIQKRKGSDPAGIVAILKNTTHRYEGLMRAGDMLDVANFVSRGRIDMQFAID
jgi:hypothetical protein